MADLTNVLAQELMALEGLRGQHPETGANLDSGASYLDQYTNRIFGAPFQLMDSVDKRFDSVNKHVGNEFLRNFILNSPILHIKPGVPKYTGGKDEGAVIETIKNVYVSSQLGSMPLVDSLIEEVAKHTIFAKGSKLQKRMFGFRETYYTYMTYVNYMCRSMAVFLNLTNELNTYSSSESDPNSFCSTNRPNGAFTNLSDISIQPFEDMKWQNYRMLTSSITLDPYDMAYDLFKASPLGALTFGTAEGVQAFAKTLLGSGTLADAFGNAKDAWIEAWSGPNTAEIQQDKVQSVLFMVEPSSFSESLSNKTTTSKIEQSISAFDKGVGSEIAFITNSNVDLGVLDDLTEFLGSTVETMGQAIGQLVEPVTGGFLLNLFNGASQAIRGQRMIYPEIYESSDSSMNYEFTITLGGPYGDVYGYYMERIVPLCHLIALAAPHMVSANTVASPFLVQAYIPGQCTCQLGIISDMNITKNPNSDNVSVNGFPLDIKVTMTIKELYNSLAISPANDPMAFLFNETLNDYMANLAGLLPSLNTYETQRISMLQSLEKYFATDEWKNDAANWLVTKYEDSTNPFIASGS